MGAGRAAIAVGRAGVSAFPPWGHGGEVCALRSWGHVPTTTALEAHETFFAGLRCTNGTGLASFLSIQERYRLPADAGCRLRAY